MQIRLLVDYRGRETGEALIYRGVVVDMPDADAQLLIKNGWAEEVGQFANPPPKLHSQRRKAKEGN